MLKAIFASLSLLVTLYSLPVTAEPSGGYQQELAFEGAMGYGRFTRGGKGGKVLVVDRLDDPGEKVPGTFRWAVDQKYPRIVRFAVSGVIELQRPLIIDEDFLTIEGQSSPAGIVIRGAQTSISASQVIVRYMRFRPGRTDDDGDALNARNQHHIIIDHCSMSWANDEVASFYNNTDFTLQHSIVAQSLNKAGHKKGEHGYGAIWGGSRASFIHNVLASHSSRNPRVNGYRLGAPYPQKEVLADIRNNVIFNWGKNSAYGGEDGRFNMVSNLFKPGPATQDKRFFQIDQKGGKPQVGKAYFAENLMWNMPELTRNNTAGVKVKHSKKLSGEQLNSIKQGFLVSQAFVGENADGQPALTAMESYQLLVEKQDVGANQPFMDSVDRAILEHIRQPQTIKGTGIIDHELEVISSWQAYAGEFNTNP